MRRKISYKDEVLTALHPRLWRSWRQIANVTRIAPAQAYLLEAHERGEIDMDDRGYFRRKQRGYVASSSCSSASAGSVK